MADKSSLSLKVAIEAAAAKARKAKSQCYGDTLEIEAWLRHYFPDTFSRPFTAYQREYWQWVASLRADKAQAPRVECHPRGVGKCLAGSTLVLLADGRQKPIADVQIGERIISYNYRAHKWESDTVTNKWAPGVKRVLKVTTTSGKAVTLTPEHRVLTLGGWTLASKLTTDHYLAACDGIVQGQGVSSVGAGQDSAAVGRGGTHPQTPPTFAVGGRGEGWGGQPLTCLSPQNQEGANGEEAANWLDGNSRVLRDAPVPVGRNSLSDGREVVAGSAQAQRASLLVEGPPTCICSHSITSHLDKKWLKKKGKHCKIEGCVCCKESGCDCMAFTTPETPCIPPYTALGIQAGQKFVTEGPDASVSHKKSKSVKAKRKPNGNADSASISADQGVAERIDNHSVGAGGGTIRAGVLSVEHSGRDQGAIAQAVQSSDSDVLAALASTPIRGIQSTRKDTPHTPEDPYALQWERVVSVEEAGEVECFDVEVEKNHCLVTNGLVSHNSTGAETAAVYALAKKVKKYVLYVSATDDQATKHLRAIKTKLENAELLRDYPHLKPKIEVVHKKVANWSAERLRTQGGQIVECISILGNSRGFKSEDSARPDLIVLDDIDSSKESFDVTKKKLDIIATEILPTGTYLTDVLMPQNLIHRDSVCAMILDKRAQVLMNRQFSGPYPLVKNIAYERRDAPDGSSEWVITDGQPYDPAISLAYAQHLLQLMGPDAFEREVQQDVWRVGADKDFREWDEVYHVCTWSEIEEGFKRQGYDLGIYQDGKVRIPGRWNVGLGWDVGTTREHPSAVSIVVRPDERFALSDSILAVGEIVMPEYPYDSTVMPELVSPGRVVRAIKRRLADMGVSDGQVEMALMSHEASSARNAVLVDLPEEDQVFFQKWRAQRGSGISQIQQLLEIDRKKPHPFRVYPKGHPQGGQPLMGKPRIFFVVEDGQGELFVDINGNLRVRGAKNARGFARARFELPIYSWRNTGEKKIDDDFCLVAGTLIETEQGPVPIEDVKVGDKVWTRSGLKEVTAAGLTKCDADIWELAASTGEVLRGTANHPVFTVNDGYKIISNLSDCDILQVWQGIRKENGIAKLLNSGAGSSTGIQTPRAMSGESISWDGTDRSRWGSMSPSGNQSTEKCRPDTTSTTKTMTRSIMTFLIWNVLALRIMQGLIKTTWTRCGLKQLTGLRRLKDAPIALQVARWLGLSFTRSLELASSARRNTSRIITTKSTAPISVAGEGKPECQKKSLNAIVSGVVENSSWWAKPKPNFAALNAEGILENVGQSEKLSARAVAPFLQQEKDALVSVKRSAVANTKPLNLKADVYNLTVEGANEYFANGILVHNCDAIRGVLNVFGPAATGKTPDERFDDSLPEHLRWETIEAQSRIATKDIYSRMVDRYRDSLEEFREQSREGEQTQWEKTWGKFI